MQIFNLTIGWGGVHGLGLLFFLQAQEPSRSRNRFHPNNRRLANALTGADVPLPSRICEHYSGVHVLHAAQWRSGLYAIAFPSTRLRLSRVRPVCVLSFCRFVSTGCVAFDSLDLHRQIRFYAGKQLTDARATPCVSTGSDPIDEIWRLMAIAVCLRHFRQQTCTSQRSAFWLGDTCHHVLDVSLLMVEFT